MYVRILRIFIRRKIVDPCTHGIKSKNDEDVEITKGWNKLKNGNFVSSAKC